MAIGRPVSLTSNVASKVISVTATASQTLFTVTGGYRINQLSVYRNGVRLVDGTDYTARDGATVTLLSPASASDVLEFQIFDDFRVADAIVSAESDQIIYGNLTVTGTLNGSTIGIQSAGTIVGTAKTLNFVGSDNTFAVNGDIIDVNIAGGVGIQSAGTVVGTGITQLNFVGTGNTFTVNGNTVDISIIRGVGIQSAGTVVGTGITQLNFVGTGNTFAVNGTTIDISIQGGGGGAGGITSLDITSSLFI